MKQLTPKWTDHPYLEGSTRIAYSKDGKYLITVGDDGLSKRYQIGSDQEPLSVDQNGAKLTSISTTRDLFVTCSEECVVTVFEISSMNPVNTVLRSSLPLRDVAFSPDSKWIAACGDDSSVKLVKADDIMETSEITGHDGGVRHLSFDCQGLYLATSCRDGKIRIFSADQGNDLKGMVVGVVPKVDDDQNIFTGVAWHPHGPSFALQTKTRDIAVYKPSVSDNNWEEDFRLEDGHTGLVTAIEWSPNGQFLATSDDSRFVIWNVDTRSIVAEHKNTNGSITSISWDPSKNSVTYATNAEVMLTFEDPVEVQDSNKRKKNDLDAFEDGEMDLDEFVEDDDNAGYAEAYGEEEDDRANGHEPPSKRLKISPAALAATEAFHSGSTPWKNNRRYLCLNHIGYVWTVDNGTHNTVTVTFYDKGVGAEYHFTDHDQFSMASLSQEAGLFANKDLASLRFHRGGWSDNWEYNVKEGDSIRAVSLSDTMVVICTTKGYVNVFNLYGTPIQVYRQSRDPVVACCTFKNDVMLVRTNGIGQLTCTIENPKLNQIYIKDEPLDVSPDKSLTSIFFTDNGDPCIYDSDGVLLALSQWKEPLQSRWVPLLDTTDLSKEKTYWPVGVENDQFNAIVLKNLDFPPIPLPNFEQFTLSVPTSLPKLEQEYLTEKALHSISEDSSRALPMDKLLLRMFNDCCTKKSNAKAMGIVPLLSSKETVAAASKIAARHGIVNLAEKIEKFMES